MLTDVVDQLRNAASAHRWVSVWTLTVVRCRLLADAATEIERLRHTRDQLLKSVASIRTNRSELLAERDQEIAWLRSTNEVLRSNIDRARRR
jgi:hypothetical protein